MAEIVRPLLTNADPTEALNVLVAGGITVAWVGVDAATQGLRAKVTDGQEAAATTLLDGYAFTKPRGQYQSPLHPAIQAAVNTFKQAEAAGFPANMTAAQRSALDEATWVLLRSLYSRFND